jgi:uncharacterized protein
MRAPIRYEWDLAKREQNLAKHGLAFEDACQVFENALKWDFPSARAGEEERRIATAFNPAAQSVCILVYVVRADSVRCISYRRASAREREEYDEYLKENHQLHQ